MTNGVFGRVTEFHYWGNAGCMTNVTESATGYGPCPHFLFHSSTAHRADVWALQVKVISLHNVLLTFTVLSYAYLTCLGTRTPIPSELFGLLQQVTNQVCPSN